MVSVNQKAEKRNNFYRLNSLIVDNSKDAFINILELHLSNTNQGFEQFINLNQHDIYHLYFNEPCCKGCCTKRKRILQIPQLELLFDKHSSTLPGHIYTCNSEFCCCKAKPNIKTDVLDVTLAYSLLINFCTDVFWYCCLNGRSKTLEDFLNIHQHDIYHLKVGPQPCGHCPPGYISPVTKEPLKERDWKCLFSGSGKPCNLTSHIAGSCCSVAATPGITTFRLSDHHTRTLHKHFCEVRKDIEVLRDKRNGLFAHAKEGSLSDQEYQSAVYEIKKAILHIAKVCNKEKEAQDALDDLERRPLDHYSFLQHHMYTLQQARDFMDLKEAIPGILIDTVNEIVYHQSKTQAWLRALQDKLLRITKEEDITDNVRAKIISVINGIPVEQTGHRRHMQITPTLTVTDSEDDLIECILHDLSQATGARHSVNLYAKVRRYIDNSGLFKPGEQSIEENMIRFLPDGMTIGQKTAYSGAITVFTKTLRYLVDVRISVLSENELTFFLKIFDIGDRNEIMKNLRQKITALMQDCRRRKFRQCMQYMSAYYNLCVLWDIVVLYLSYIFSINSCHSNIIYAEMRSIKRQRHDDKKLIQCLVRPQKETVIFALLYTPDQWLPVKSFLDNRDMKSANLDHLCSGQFTITPFEYKSSTVYMSMFGSCLRWSYSNEKFTSFTFRKTSEAGKTYYHISPADYPDCYVTMGMFSWLVRCKKGNPEGCNESTWVLERFGDNADACYVLCTKDSNGNCLTAGSTKRLHGKRGHINKRRMWLIRKSHSFTDDGSGQLMQTM